MRLYLKHVTKKKTGQWQYRRRVPKGLYFQIGKNEFKKVLGDTEAEASRAYQKYHFEVERIIQKAQRQIEQGRAATDGELTEYETYLHALDRFNRYYGENEDNGLDDDMESIIREAEVDQIIAKYPLDKETGYPIYVSKFDGLYAQLLINGTSVKPPEFTLIDAKNFYLNHKPENSGEPIDRTTINRIERTVRFIIEKHGSNPILVSLRREDAHRLKQELSQRLKSGGEFVAASTATRELNDICAIINYAKTEMKLPADFQNPFANLGGVATSVSSRRANERLPLPPDVIIQTREQLLNGNNAQLSQIWRILENTGCRIAEISGLRLQDVVLEGDFPHLNLIFHERRRLKNNSSVRLVPLIGDALIAAKEAVKAAGGNEMLFERYATVRGADSVSQGLMKRIRRTSTNSSYTVHSLRHNMKDWLTLARVSDFEQGILLGHDLGTVGNRVYGSKYAKLEATTTAVQAALEVKNKQLSKAGHSS